VKNTTLAQLCEKRANKVSRSPLANSFEAQLHKLKSIIDKLTTKNEPGEDKIKEYCDGLRNEVQLHLEESTESLKKQSLELIQKIDEYENEAKLKFDTNHNLRLDTFLSETRRFHEKWADYLKQFEINEEELKLASLDAKKLQNRLNIESELFLSKA
jgi:exonuclease VII small subunit